MDKGIPDLNDTYEEPMFYYNLAQGYMCPDSVDGFEFPDGIEDGDVITPYVRIPFDQGIADSHLGEPEKRNDEVLVGSTSVGVAVELEDEQGFVSWLDDKVLGVNMTPREAEIERKLWRGRYEAWKDMFVVFCPAAMHIPSWQGGFFQIIIYFPYFVLIFMLLVCGFVALFFLVAENDYYVDGFDLF